MIIVLKPHSTEETITRVENMVKNRGLDTHIVRGTEMTIIGCIGDTTLIDPRLFEVDSSVDKVMHVQEPYKLANRAFHPEDSVIDVSGVKIGGGWFPTLILCSGRYFADTTLHIQIDSCGGFPHRAVHLGIDERFYCCADWHSSTGAPLLFPFLYSFSADQLIGDTVGVTYNVCSRHYVVAESSAFPAGTCGGSTERAGWGVEQLCPLDRAAPMGVC